MEATKTIAANQGKLLDEKVETPNRLEDLVLRYPNRFDDFREFFREHGVSDQVFYNLRKNRQVIKPVHRKLIDRMVKNFSLIER